MANEKNLRPGAYKFTKEDSSKGGKNSGKSKREKKAIQALLNDFLARDVGENNITIGIAEHLGIKTDMSIKELFTIACILNSLGKADLDSLDKLMKITGEQTSADVAVIEKLDEVLKGIDDAAK